MKRNSRSFLTACLVFVPIVAANAQPSDRGHESAITEARESVSNIMGAFGVPGVSVAVGVDGEVVWSEGFGYADLENRVPVTPETRMRIASVSKPVTAAAVAKLVEAGRLDLDADIRTYVSYFPDKGRIVATRQLAGHLAGIRHYRDQEYFIRDHFATVRDGLSVFLNDSLMHPPGTAYLYSSYGWNLISAVVEGSSGRDFLSYMHGEIFEPLGMDNTIAEFVDSLIPNRPRFYRLAEDGAILNAVFVDNSLKWAGGGFLSTAEDLVRFGSAHLGPGFLNEMTLDLLFTSQQTLNGEETGYGIGWQVREVGGRRTVGHSGGAVGGSSMLIVMPESRLVVAAIGNLEGGPMRSLAESISEIFLRYGDVQP